METKNVFAAPHEYSCGQQSAENVERERMSEPAFISVGLPTYNRVSSLKRAVASVLSQGHAHWELVISDNASSDATREWCEELSERDKRVRFFRHEENLGPTANFQTVLQHARGEFFMWLSDDDWLDPTYLAQCARGLREQPDHALICGGARYYDGEKLVLTGRAINLTHASPQRRVAAYYRQVDDNAMFYGLMRREQLARATLQNVAGGDWILMAQMAFQGKVRTLADCHINRSVGGASKDTRSIVRALRLPEALGAFPKLFYLAAAASIYADIAWKSPLYRPLGTLRRRILAGAASWLILRRFCLCVNWYPLKSTLNKPVLYVRGHLQLRTRVKAVLRRLSKDGAANS